MRKYWCSTFHYGRCGTFKEHFLRVEEENKATKCLNLSQCLTVSSRSRCQIEYMFHFPASIALYLLFLATYAVCRCWKGFTRRVRRGAFNSRVDTSDPFYFLIMFQIEHKGGHSVLLLVPLTLTRTWKSYFLLFHVEVGVVDSCVTWGSHSGLELTFAALRFS